MRFSSKFTLGVFILCAAAFLSGCAPKMVTFLAGDSLAKDKGLIVVRVRIKDQTGALVGIHPRMGLQSTSLPSLVVQKEGERDTNDEAWIFLDKYGNTFQKMNDGTYYFDQYYYMEAGAGRYFINYLNLQLSSKREMVYEGTRTESTYLNVPLYAVIDVKSNGLSCVGSIEFDLTSIQADKHMRRPSYKYTMMLDDSQKQTEQILKHFKTNYPITSQKLTGRLSIEKASFGVYVNFNKYVSSSSQQFSRWNEIFAKKCKITANSNDALLMDSQETKKNKFWYTTMRDSLALPNSYTLNYQIRWYEGMKDAAYGLVFVQNDKNRYFFGVTAAGEPTLWINKEGQWLPDPKTKKALRFLGSRKQADDFKIEYKDAVFTYYINDEVVATIRDQLEIKKAQVGFFITGKQKAAVDYFTIVGR